MSAAGFLGTPEPTAEAQRLFDEDVGEEGFVMNVSRLWAYQPATLTGLFGLMGEATSVHRLTRRQRGILVAAWARKIALHPGRTSEDQAVSPQLADPGFTAAAS